MNNDTLLDEAAQHISLINNYTLLENIGQGAFKKVYKIKTGKDIVALKISSGNFDRTDREIEALKRIKHPNITCLLDFGMFDYKNSAVS